MSSFTTPLDLRYVGGRFPFELLAAFIYEIGGLSTGAAVYVLAGTRTDFASIPWLVRWLLSPTDPHYAAAAVVHDFLYQQAVTRLIADAIFYEAMIVLGCPLWKRKLVYYGVRWGGWWTWRQYKRANRKRKMEAQETFTETMLDDAPVAP